MMFLKIIPVTRRGANTPPETGAPELLRVDLVRRASPVKLAGTDFWCLRLSLEGGQTVDCTGTIADLIAALDEPVYVPDDPEPNEPVVEPEPDTRTIADSVVPDRDLSRDSGSQFE